MNARRGRKPVWVAADRSLGRFSVFCRDGANGRERDERPSETVVDGAVHAVLRSLGGALFAGFGSRILWTYPAPYHNPRAKSQSRQESFLLSVLLRGSASFAGSAWQDLGTGCLSEAFVITS